MKIVMPTYDYICEKCETEFEQFQSITAKPLRKCPDCGKNGLKRLIGAGSGVIFKGNGFYHTDYRSESYKKGEKAEKDTAGKTKKKSETKKTKADKKPKSSSEGKKKSK